MSLAAIIQSLSNPCAQSQPFIKNSARVSVTDGFLVAGNLRTTMAAPKTTYKKNIVHPFCYLFRKREKDTWSSGPSSANWDWVQTRQNFWLTFDHMQKGRIIKVSNLPNYTGHLQPTCLNWEHCTVPPLWASWWHWQCVCECMVVCMNWSKMLCVLPCVISSVYLLTVTEHICILVRDADYTSIPASDTKQSVCIFTRVLFVTI